MISDEHGSYIGQAMHLVFENIQDKLKHLVSPVSKELNVTLYRVPIHMTLSKFLCVLELYQCIQELQKTKAMYLQLEL